MKKESLLGNERMQLEDDPKNTFRKISNEQWKVPELMRHNL